ncbi:MAG: HPt (histidine-containing phosphotransfer) domain-containing protein [Cognaticolwellia sp.]|jgi:HPt (histidine-containing phosphotransfer) domain-containing protein
MAALAIRTEETASVKDLNAETLAILRSYSAPGMDFVAEVVGAFMSTVDPYMSQIDAGVAEGDCEGVHRAAHPLKSSSMQVGAEAFAEVCKALETAGRTGDADSMASLNQELKLSWARVKPLLQAELS